MKFHSITYDNLLETIHSFSNEQGYQLLLDIIGVDNSGRDGHNGLELIYLLLNMDTHSRIALKLEVKSDIPVPTLFPIFASAKWLEREVWDMFGIKFSQDISNTRILNNINFKGHQLLKDYKRLKVTAKSEPKDLSDFLVIDSTHASISEPLRLLYELDGEDVVSCEPDIGHNYRGIEKLCESRNFNQIIPLVERLNHNSSAINGVAWAKAIEEHNEIEITDRSKVLRMIFMELARISNHMLELSRVLDILNLNRKSSQLAEMIDAISRLFESYCGRGFLGNIARIGGLTKDIPMGWISECYQTIQLIGRNFDRFQMKLLNSRVWCERTRICVLKADDAIRFGVTGPCLRACGINYDLRKVSPYYFYRDLNFDVPLGLNGDAYDRNLVRMEEIRQSLRIIDQLLDNVPVGDVTGIFASKDADLSQLTKIKKGESYTSVESANGELGYYLISDGSIHPHRLKIRTPSLALMQAFPTMVKGSTLCDSLVSFMSMNIASGEMDR